MAKSVGKFTGVGYRPLQGDIATDILNAEDQEFAHRAEDRLVADRKAKTQAEKERKAKEGLTRAKALKLYDTGSDSLNGTIAEAITIATNEYPELFKILDDTSGKYSQQEKIKAKLKYDNILNLPENLKTMTNSVMGEFQEYQKGLASGSIFRDEAFESKFADGFKGVSISLDDDGLPVSIFRTGQQDSNLDGVIDANDIETMGSLNDIYSRPQFQKNFSYDAMVKQHSDKLVSAVNTTDNGIRKTTTTGVEDDLLESTVKRFLYNDDGTPTAPMLAFAKQRNLDPNDSKNLKTIENDYKNDIYLRTKRGKVTDVDGSTALANKKYNDENKEGSVGEVTTPTSQTYGIYHSNIDGTKVNSVNVQNSNVIPSVKTEKGDFVTNLTPHNITRDKYGRMVIEGSFQTTKSITMTEDKFQKELAEATKNNDFDKIMALEDASGVDGGRKVTLPGEIKRKDITVSKEDEALVAEKTGTTIEELDKSIYKEESKEDVDEYGVPIKK